MNSEFVAALRLFIKHYKFELNNSFNLICLGIVFSPRLLSKKERLRKFLLKIKTQPIKLCVEL
jgi:hypothetical protein